MSGIRKEMKYQNIARKALLCIALVGSQLFLAETARAEMIRGFAQDENYYIPMNVASSGYYTINLSSHFGADADLYLYDANNALVASSTEGGSDVLEGTINPGSYTIRIHMYMCLPDSCSANINVRREGRQVRLLR